MKRLRKLYVRFDKTNDQPEFFIPIELSKNKKRAHGYFVSVGSQVGMPSYYVIHPATISPFDVDKTKYTRWARSGYKNLEGYFFNTISQYRLRRRALPAIEFIKDTMGDLSRVYKRGKINEIAPDNIVEMPSYTGRHNVDSIHINNKTHQIVRITLGLFLFPGFRTYHDVDVTDKNIFIPIN